MISLPHDRMNQVVKRFDMLEAQMAAGPAPDVYVKLASEYSDIQDLVARIRELRSAEQELVDLDAMLSDKGTDAEMRALAEMDKPEVEERIEALQREIQILLLPKDAADDKSAILEMRAGTGGDEAALFRRRPLPHVRALCRPPRAGSSSSCRQATAMPAATRKSSRVSRARACSRI
jgi:peptide chain release factor 1